MFQRFHLISVLSLAVLCSQALVLPADAAISDTGFFLDTITKIDLYDSEDEALLKDCFSLLSDYENLFSRTIEGSDVWNINHSAGKTVTVSPETASLLETALSYCEQSDGAFDITIAPVVSLWDFTGETHSLPDEALLSEALTHVNYQNIKVDGQEVTLLDPDLGIDLGGIAKGYIADCLKEYLTQKGVTSGMINLGGNVLTIGSKPDGSDWRIGIRKPFAGTADLAAIVSCSDLSVVTSGTYERYFELDGNLYHHILDTKTGYPISNGLTSVTILSENSVNGDALSTTCFVLGLEDGLAFAESLDGIEAMFITEDETLHYTSGFPENEKG